MAFLAEIKRRRVGKVAIAYGAVAWGVTEGSSVVLPALGVPEWVLTWIVVFLLVGFPVAMVLAWIFDVGPDGIQRTEPLPEEAPAAQVKLRIAYAVAVLACMAGLGYVLYERGVGRANAGAARSSIAVMPFANLSGDQSKDYFSDGMSEELLNLLARVPGLQVAARTSSFAYKGREVDVREIGKELGVETVLEGSVRQAGDQVRITAQLIDTDTGFHLWSETYDRKMADIFQVQDEIAQAIVAKLRIQLAPADQVAQQKVPTQNVEAYELYLQGRAVWKKRGEENLRKAIELYQAALARDPGFARAHAALASAYVVLPGYTKDENDQEKFFGLAETSARQALAIDPNIGEAHAVLAQLNADRGDLLDAESGFFFAISLEPNEPTPHHWYSLLLSKVGRVGAALTQAQRAQELDPTSPILAANLANVYLQQGNDEEALRYSRMARDLGIGNGSGGNVEAAVALRRKQWSEGERLLLAQHGVPEELKPLVHEFIEGLSDPSARPRVVASLRKTNPDLISQAKLVDVYSSLGEIDLAYQVMFDALDKDHLAWIHDWEMSDLWSPDSAAMRRSPKLGELAERIGVVDYWKQYGFPDQCRPGTGGTPIVCS